jgi:hypothetical protein
VLPDSDRLRIRRFVQESLGCGCSDTVFDRIDLIQDRLGAILQLSIGGRLLIRVHLLERAEDVLPALPRWLVDGAAEREELGLKRLRVVVGARNPEAIEAPARGVFGRLAPSYGDVHLHVRSLPALCAALGDVLFPPCRGG